MRDGTSQREINVAHVTIRSAHPFDQVKQKLEAVVPPLNESFYALLRQGGKEHALQVLEALPPLSIFGSRDHGSLLMIAGLQRRAIQYEIGNPLTASKMTRLHISAALYAPIRVLLREDEEGIVAFEYDRPASVFGLSEDPRVDETARKLDHDLFSVLENAAA